MATISDYFSIRPRFRRSIHLQKDFDSDESFDQYVVTPATVEAATRIIACLTLEPHKRAWRITGDYGVGKSSFALFLVNALCGRRDRVGRQDRSIDGIEGLTRPKPLFPVLVTGSRSPLCEALIQAIVERIGRYPTIPGASSLNSRVEAVAAEFRPNGRPLSVRSRQRNALDLLESLRSDLVQSGEFSGVLIVIDELGKFVENSWLQPAQEDTYLLQELAEAACRSGDAPMVVLGLLHQRFEAYARQMSLASLREWDKVAGRFEEILYGGSIPQTVQLLSEALSPGTKKLPETERQLLAREMERVVGLGWYGAQASRGELEYIAGRLYPLHSTVPPVAIRFFRKFGQNERSLFSFIHTLEPFGVQDFARNSYAPARHYRLANFYDYVQAVFGAALSQNGAVGRWHQSQEIIDSNVDLSTEEVQLLKTIAVLNLVEDQGLVADEGALTSALAGDVDSVLTLLHSLETKRGLLFRRGKGGAYTIWARSTLDVSGRYEDAVAAVVMPTDLALRLVPYLDDRSLVARRHSIQTGTLRTCQVVYCTLHTVTEELRRRGAADLALVVILSNTPEDAEQTAALAMSSKWVEEPQVIVATSQALSQVEPALMELLRWEWVQGHTPELVQDSHAASEVSRLVLRARAALRSHLDHFVGLHNDHGLLNLRWFRCARTLTVESRRDLLKLVSHVCDEVYHHSALVRNELINRHEPSASANAARARLIERMFMHPAAPRLGMDGDRKPAELAIYYSFMQEGKLHSQAENSWRLQFPTPGDDPLRLLPSIDCILDILEEAEGDPVPIRTICSRLTEPPLGIRAGLHPLFLALVIAVRPDVIAVYERGSFVTTVDGNVFARLTKAPDTFSLQYCHLAGVRVDILQTLAGQLRRYHDVPAEPLLLDVVRPLLEFYALLPEYTRQTRELPLQVRQIRDLLRPARDPFRLVFLDLPKACGLVGDAPAGTGYRVDELSGFAETLREALDTLRAAYPRLIEHTGRAILAALDISEGLTSARVHISTVASRIMKATSNLKLKAFCARLGDRTLGDETWVESVGALLAGRPMRNWTDRDVEVFHDEVVSRGRHFQHAAVVQFPSSSVPSKTSWRVGVTLQDGTDAERVVTFDSSQLAEIQQVRTSILEHLRKHPTVALPAAAGAILELLREYPGVETTTGDP